MRGIRNQRTRGLAAAMLVVATLVAACESDPTDPVPAPVTPVASVTVAPKTGTWTGTAKVGQSIALAATPRAADGSVLPVTTVTWSSADPSVAAVSAAGVVEARREGSTEVSATIGGKVGRIAVTVTADVDSVYVSPGAAVLEIGERLAYTARAFDVRGNELSGRIVEWSTPSPTVIELSMYGIARAIAPGYGEVRATIEGVTAAVGLTVPTPEPVTPVAHVFVTPGEVAVYRGLYVELKATTVGPTGGTLEGRQVQWFSENPAVAQVGAGGLVLGVGKGTSRIRAVSEGQVGYATVHVRELPTGPVQTYGLQGTANHATPYIEIGSTTWTDTAGAAHEAYLVVRGGTLRFDMEAGTYSQSFTVETRLQGADPYAPAVDTRDEVDEGTFGYDLFTGLPILTSTTTPGLEIRATSGGVGEFTIPQSVLGTAMQPWVWIIL